MLYVWNKAQIENSKNILPNCFEAKQFLGSFVISIAIKGIHLRQSMGDGKLPLYKAARAE